MGDITTYGKVQRGKLVLHSPELLKESLLNFMDGAVEVLIKRVRSKHSDPQRGYYHGVVVPIVTNAINEQQGEEAFTRADVHEYLKQQFNTKRVLNADTNREVRIAESTSNLNTAEYSIYIDKCRDWAGEILDVFIPDPIPEMGRAYRKVNQLTKTK